MNKIRIIILLFLCTITFEQSFAQNNIITGKIVDAETHKPIDLVSVYCSPANTITNEDGEFELKNFIGDSITFSHINYKIKKYKTIELPQKISLQPKIFEIDEIVINPDNNIIIKEVQSIRNKYIKLFKDKNYANVTFYYRQLISTNDIYNEFIECFFNAQTSLGIETLTLREGRIATLKNDSIFTIGFFNFFGLLGINPIKTGKIKRNTLSPFLCDNFENIFDINVDKIIYKNDDDEIKIYKFTPKQNINKNLHLVYGNLYVRTKDNTIIRCEQMITDKRIMNGYTPVDKLSIKIDIIYKNGDNGYPMIDLVNGTAEINYFKDDKIYTQAIKSTLFATDYKFSTQGNKLDSKDNLFSKVAKSKYDAAFWDNNPIVKRTQIEQKLLDDFTRLGYFGNFELNK